MFGKKTVASILAKYHNIIDELKEHLEAKLAEAEKHNKIMLEAELLHAEAINEAKKAMTTVENFEKLLGIK